MYEVEEKNKRKIFTHRNTDNINTTMNLFPGIYDVHINSSMFGTSVYFKELKDKTEQLIDIKSGVFKQITDRVSLNFSDATKETYSKLGISHKMGVLLHGRAGTGKSTLAYILANHLVRHNNAIALFFFPMDADAFKHVVNIVRESNPHNMIICIMDEFESYMRRDEEGYLPIFDGVGSLDNILYIGCTNYIDQIADRVKDRPSRFNVVKEVDSLPLEAYQQFTEEKLSKFDEFNTQEIAFMAEENKLTIDELKHVILNMVIGDLTFKQSLELVSNKTEEQ